MRLAKPPREWARFLGALLVTVAVRLALTLLPYRAFRMLIERLPRGSGARSVETSVWAVKAASRFVPGATCLTQALTLEAILWRQGIDARTHFGVAKSANGSLQAHAWVESGGQVLLGEARDLDYVPLTAGRATGL